MRLSYAIVMVSDMKRSLAFYSELLGLPVRFESPDWTELATDGATLALHRTNIPGDVSDGAGSGPAGRCRPGIQVPDLAAVHDRMLSNGVECVQSPKESFGGRIAQYRDPDGLIVAVSEAAAT